MKIQIKTISGNLIFEWEEEENTVKKTVVNAISAGANLRSADLQYADLQYADLRYADLRYADLRSANLRSANLQYANLQSANLQYADLQYAKNAGLAIAQTRIVPGGTLIVWKKCKDNVIVKLRVPAKAKRSNAFGRKCRAEYVKVLEVIGAKVGVSLHDGVTQYIVGETVKCDKWDDEFMNECSGGIHFYITKEEAENN